MGAWFFNLGDVDARDSISIREACVAWSMRYLLWLRDNGALADFPVGERALNIGLEPGGECLLDLVKIAQIVTFSHGSLVEIREQRCEPLDVVVWLLEQLGDGNGVMEARRESQQHELYVYWEAS